MYRDTLDLRQIYNNKRERVNKKGQLLSGFKNVTFVEFERWFTKSNFDKGCFYCGLTNEQSRKLHEKRNSSTRGGKRGKRLELDRINPVLHYDELDNLLWCCYWCNNAKSNFFSNQEFRPIAVEIGKALFNILQNDQQIGC